MTEGQTIIGTRHRGGCLCGCQFVAGQEGVVIEALDDVLVARFDAACCGRGVLVAYER